MKKLLALSLAILLCLSVFAACDISMGNEETTTAGKEETTAGKEETTAGKEETTTGKEETTTGKEETTLPEETTTPGSAYDVEAAIEYLDSLYKNELNVTAADYELVGQLMIGLDKYMVSWAVDSDKVNAVEGSPYWTIEVDEMSKETVNYKITATVTAPDGTTGSISYDRVVPEFIVTSFEDYMAAEADTVVTVAGIVVGINAKSVGNTRNHLFLADVDGKGGYYCYQLDKDPLEEGVALGMTVAVTAPVSPYSGMQETKGGDFVIVDETIKEIPVLDITETFAAGESLKNYVGLVVTIKGVTIADQNLGGTSEYLNFELNGQKAYVRTYVTDFPTTLVADDKATIDAAHAENFGNTADATGILVLYSGNPYLIPTSTDCFSNYQVVTKTDAEKVEAEKEGLKLPASYTSDTVVDLLAVGQYYDDVAITWALTEENAAATLAEGKLTLVVPDAETIVKITATITCGEVTDTKNFEIKLSKSITAIKDAIEIGAAKDHNTYTEEKYLIAGIIKEVYNETYGNMYIVDELGNVFTVYGTYMDGKKYGEFEGAKPVAGDYVVLLGVLGQYNGTPQMKNADIMSFTAPITIPEANELGNTFEKNQYTEDKKVITGEIIEVQNTTYGNVVIKDAEGNSILVYGLYSSNGATRYDAMATQPAVGDTITVLGIIGKYNAPQMKNGWLIAYTAATEEGTEEGTETPEDSTTPEDPEVPEIKEVSLTEAITLEDGTDVIVKGTVKEINTEWSDKYGNISVTIEDAEGNTLYIFRLSTKVVVGDVVTITGKVGSYNGSKQIAQGATATIDDPAPVEVTLTEAIALDDGRRVIVKGTVKEINTEWSDKYGNISVTIEDAEGNTLYIFRLATKVVVGDVVTITGKVGSYNGSKQIAAGATAVVEQPTPADATKAASSIEAIATENSWSDSTLYAEFKLDDNITVAATGTPVGEYSLNTGKYYASSNTWRIYQNETPSVTITAAEGKTIVSVKITYSTKNSGVLTLGEDQIVSDTVVEVNAATVTFSVGNTGEKTNGQAQITAIEVIYK